MPLILMGLAGLGWGAFAGAQADDVVENLTGEKGGIPWIQIGILTAGGVVVWRMVKAA